jgi:hypothetical protein
MLLDITCPKMKSGSSVIEKGRSKETAVEVEDHIQ